MALYDELNLFWGILIFIGIISCYVVGLICYKLGYRNGEYDMSCKMQKHIAKQVQRGMIKRV